MSDEAGMLRVNSDGTVSGNCISGAGSPMVSSKKVSEEEALSQLLAQQIGQDLKPLQYPSIYIFRVKKLNEMNHFLAVKVGDTVRNVDVRLDEWRHKGYNLEKLGQIHAFIEEMKDGHVIHRYFHDHTVHRWLHTQGYIPVYHSTKKSYWSALEGNDLVLPDGLDSLSQEFYLYEEDPNNKAHEISQKTLDNFLEEVKKHPEDFNLTDNFTESSEVVVNWREDGYKVSYSPFLYQKKAVRELIEKHEKTPTSKTLLVFGTGSGKSNMFCYAIKGILGNKDDTFSDRFSFTQKSLVPAVSAIPDVLEEIHRAVDTHTHFREKMTYISAKDFVAGDAEEIQRLWKEFDVVILGVSLQNLAGRTEDGDNDRELKKIHKILNELKPHLDLVIGDEAHFAMFGQGEEYKAALQTVEQSDSDISISDLKKRKKDFTLSPKMGFIFATATAEKLLIQDIFSLDESVVYVPDHVIKEEKEKQNAAAIKNGNPSASPFFGMPEIYYAALELGSIQELMRLNDDESDFRHKERVKAVFSALFGKTIDKGKKVPPLLSKEILKAHGIGKHVLVQVSTISTAEALKKLLEEINTQYGLEYLVKNVSDSSSNGNSTSSYKNWIAEHRNEKTLTITVRKMITGVSIPYWDTIIRAKGGESTTEIQQLWGRANRRWIEKVVQAYKADDGSIIEEERTECFKPNVFIIELNSKELYEIQNSVESLAETLDNENFIKDKSNKPYLGKVFSWDEKDGKMTFSSMTRADIHEQLEAYLKKESTAKLVKRIEKPLNVLDSISEGFWDNVKIKSDGTVSIRIMNSEEVLDERDIPIPDNEENTISDSSENQSEDENNSSDNDSGKTEALSDRAQKAKEKILIEKKNAFFESIYSTLILYGLLYESDQPVEVLESILKSFETEQGQRLSSNLDIHYEGEMKNILEALSKNKLIVNQLRDSIVAVRAQAYSLGEGLTDSADNYIEAVTKLNRVSENEVMTPGRKSAEEGRTDVAKLIVDKLELTPEKLKDMAYGRGVLDIADKNAALLQEVYRQAEDILQETSEKQEILENLRKKLYSIPTSPVTYELVRRFFELRGWPIENVIWDKDGEFDEYPWLKKNWAINVTFAIRDPDLKVTYGEKESKIGKIKVPKDVKMSKEDLEELSEKLKTFIENSVINTKFDAVVGNPPYQITWYTDSGKKMDQDIFHEFQDTALIIAKKTSMIYPSLRWLQQAGKNTKEWGKILLKNSRLVSVDHYPSSDIFGNVGPQDGVSIVLLNDSNNHGKFLLNKELVDAPKSGEIISLNPKIGNIAKKSILSLGGQTLSRKYLSQKYYGIESDHLKKNPNSMIPVSQTPSTFKEPIKILTIGLKSSPEWFWIEKATLKHKETIPNWKVLVSSSHPVRDFSQKVIIAPNEVHGRSKVSLGQFSTQFEAKSFMRFLSTPIITLFFGLSPDGLSQCGVFVPDLKDYTNSNPLFKTDKELKQTPTIVVTRPDGAEIVKESGEPLTYRDFIGKNLNNRLYLLFGLTEEEIELIESSHS